MLKQFYFKIFSLGMCDSHSELCETDNSEIDIDHDEPDSDVKIKPIDDNGRKKKENK